VFPLALSVAASRQYSDFFLAGWFTASVGQWQKGDHLRNVRAAQQQFVHALDRWEDFRKGAAFIVRQRLQSVDNIVEMALVFSAQHGELPFRILV